MAKKTFKPSFELHVPSNVTRAQADKMIDPIFQELRAINRKDDVSHAVVTIQRDGTGYKGSAVATTEDGDRTVEVLFTKGHKVREKPGRKPGSKLKLVA